MSDFNPKIPWNLPAQFGNGCEVWDANGHVICEMSHSDDIEPMINLLNSYKELEEVNEAGFQQAQEDRDKFVAEIQSLKGVLHRMAKSGKRPSQYPMCDNGGRGCPACELAEETLEKLPK